MTLIQLCDIARIPPAIIRQRHSVFGSSNRESVCGYFYHYWGQKVITRSNMVRNLFVNSMCWKQVVGIYFKFTTSVQLGAKVNWLHFEVRGQRLNALFHWRHVDSKPQSSTPYCWRYFFTLITNYHVLLGNRCKIY